MIHNNDELKRTLESLEDDKHYAMVLIGSIGRFWYYVNGPFKTHEEAKKESCLTIYNHRTLCYRTGSEIKKIFEYSDERYRMMVFVNEDSPFYDM